MTLTLHEKSEAGVARLTWEGPSWPQNAEDAGIFLATLQRLRADGGVHRILLIPPAGATAGLTPAEIARSLAADRSGEDLRQRLRPLQDLRHSLSQPGTPVVIVLQSPSDGTAAELALACAAVVLIEGASCSLSTIREGLPPLLGSISPLLQRLPAQAAIATLWEGKPLSAGAAPFLLGAASPEEAEDIAVSCDLSPARLSPVPEDFARAQAAAQSRPFGRSPAFGVLNGVLRDPAAEADLVAKALQHPATFSALRTAWISAPGLRKTRPEAALPKQVGVIGAGMMGSGIAAVSARAGFEVRLTDATAEGLSRGMAACARILRDNPDALGRITAVEGIPALSGCDLVIEAVFEDPAVKADVIRQAEAVLRPDAVLATNTSSLPVDSLAVYSQRPGQFIGLHFFSPVEHMTLVEVIRATGSAPGPIALAERFVQALGKTPVHVKDARYFFANRCIVPYLNECLRMVAEGIDPGAVDAACRSAGLPMGGLQLMDETSMELGVRIAAAAKAAAGAAYADDDADAVLIRLLALGRNGRRSGGGFYDYDETGRRLGVWSGFADEWPRIVTPAAEVLENRLLLVQSLEAVRALEAGVIATPAEGDVAAVLGWGFAPWSGGPFSWLDLMGAGRIISDCETLTRDFGPRFAPPALLVEKAHSGEGFYDE